MKKVILFAAAVAAIALASCKKDGAEGTGVDSLAADTAIVVDSAVAVVDTTVVDSAVAAK